MANQKVRKAVGYVRVSTAGQVEGTSLDEQRRWIESHCDGQNYLFLHHYSDEGASGSVMERPQFQQMLADAQKGRFDIIVVLAIDRLSRNLRHFLNTFKSLKDLGIGLISVTQPIDTESDLGEFTINLLSLLADFERKQISSRTKSGKRAATRNGTCLPGRPPFGFIFNKETKSIEINENQQRIYLEMVDLYTVDKLTSPQIAKVFTQKGYLTPGYFKGGKRPPSTRWSAGMVMRILHNSAYKGQASYFMRKYKTEISQISGNPYHRRTNEKSGEGIVVSFPPMISSQKWNLLRRRLSINKRIPKRKS